MPLLSRKSDLEDQYSTSDEPLDKKNETKTVDEQLQEEFNNSVEEFTDDDLLADLELRSEDEQPESYAEIMRALNACDDAPLTPITSDVAPAVEWSKKVTEPESEWSKKVTAVAPETLSKKVTRRFRSSDSIDIEAIRKIQQFRVCPEAPIETPLVGDFHPPISDPLKPANDNALPVWELTKDRAKLAASTWALQVSGKLAVSWTLNLTPERINEALRHPSGFTECMGGYLKRAFERELGYSLPYWISADVSATGRLHLHGAIAADEQELEAFERALRHAGGHGPKPVKDDHMVDLNPQRCDEGWAIYSIRNASKVRRLIKGRTTFITGPLRSEGKWTYDEVRRIIHAARK